MGLTEGKSNTKANSNPNDSNPNPNVNPNPAVELNNSSADFTQTNNATDSPQPQTAAPTAPKTAFAKWESRDEKGNQSKLYWLAAEKCFVLVNNARPKFEYFYHYAQDEAEVKDAFAMPSSKIAFQPQDAPKEIAEAYKFRIFKQLETAQANPQAEEVSTESSEKAMVENTNSYLSPLKDWFKVADGAPQDMAMPIQLDAKNQTLKATELYGKPDPTAEKIKKALDKKQHKNGEKENIFYIVFVNKKGELGITKKGQEMVKKNAQEIMIGNGLDIKVEILEINRAFTADEYDLLGQKDRMCYVADKTIANSKEMDLAWDGVSGQIGDGGVEDGGHTFASTHYTGKKGQANVGVITPGVCFMEDNLAITGASFDNAKETFYKKQMRQEFGFGTENRPVGEWGRDAGFWIARNAIHEGIGHGTLGSGHRSDNQVKDIYPNSMMLNGLFPVRKATNVNQLHFPMDYKLEGQQIPEQAEFTKEDLKVLQNYYNTKTGSIIKNNDGTEEYR